MLTEVYSQAHMRSILNAVGLKISTETYNDFLCLCPFHGNRNTPSFSVSHTKGVYLCFNTSCDASGTIIELVKNIKHLNEFEVLRFIQSCKNDAVVDFEDELSTLLEDKPDFVEFDRTKLDTMYESLQSISGDISGARQYLYGRGIDDECIEHFRIGYSEKQDMLIVPVHSPDGLPVGLVGRGLHEKRFKNSRNLPRSKTLFNLHRAKRLGGTAIVCESSFDAIRIHRAGFPNVVATLGGFISKENVANLNRYFSKIIIMTDNDKKSDYVSVNCRKCYPKMCMGHSPGRELGMTIARSLKNKEVLWAVYDDNDIYPHHAKDAGDMTDEEIAHCIKNAISDIEYSSIFPL